MTTMRRSTRRSRAAVAALLVTLALPAAGAPAEPVAASAPALEMVVQSAHTVDEVAWSPDGVLLVTAGDLVLKVWRVTDGRLLRTLAGHGKVIEAIAVSPDGSLVASGSQDGTVRLWNVDGTGVRILAPIGTAGDTALSVAFSPDGRTVVAGWGSSGISAWSTDGTPRFAVAGVEASHQVNGVAFSPDGARLYSAGGDRKLRIWDASGRLLREVAGHAEVVLSIAVSPDGARLVTGDEAGAVRVWTAGGDPVAAFAAHAEPVDALSPGPGNDGFVSCSVFEGVVSRWRFDGSPAWTRPAFAVKCIACAPDGRSVASGRTNAVHLVDAADGTETRRITGPALYQRGAALLPDGKTFVVATGPTARFWGTDTLPGPTVSSRMVAFSQVVASRDGGLVAGAGGSRVALASASGVLQREWQPADALVQDIAFLAPGNRLASAHWDGSVVVSAMDGSRVAAWNAHEPRTLKAVAGSPDGSLVATGGTDRLVKLWAAGGTAVRTLSDARGWVNDLAFSPDGRLLAAATTGDGVRIWGAGGGAPPAPAAPRLAAAGSVNRVVFSPDGTRIASGDLDSRVVIWSLDGTRLAEWRGVLGPVASLAFSPDGALLLVGYRWATQLVRLADRSSCTLVLSDTGWVLYTDDGLFDASRDGGRLVAMSVGMDSIGIEQLAVTNNRPDLILARLGTGDPGQVAWYARQHERRLRRLGLEPGGRPSEVHLPETRLRSVRQDGDRATLSFSLADSAVDLASWTVFANDVPVQGLANRPVSGRSADVTVTVDLTAGANKLEVSCRNARGAESYRQQANLSCDRIVVRDLWYLGFGVSRYRDPGLALAWAHQDALDLAAAFTRLGGSSASDFGADVRGRLFGAVHARVFTDAEVTPAAIRGAREFLAGARPDDVLVLFIAGHGVHDRDPEATYYFLPWGADLADLPGTAADFDLVEAILDEVAPRAKLFLMDTCESGEVDEPAAVGPAAAPSSSVTVASGARGIAVTKAAAGEVTTGVAAGGSGQTATEPRPWLLERDRYIGNDLRRRSGAVVFSSARGGELSYERDDLANGVFTEEILKALSSAYADADGDGVIAVDELRAYVERAVAAATGGFQHPTVDRDNLSIRFAFPLASAARARRD